MDDLFTRTAEKMAPLADRMRPLALSEFLGQTHLIGSGRLLRRAIEADKMQSSIFWGPPGCGKTTLAAIIAKHTQAAFVKLNAVTSGVAELREVLKEAQQHLKLYGRQTYLLLDECHRWSKTQSDSMLPAIEKGTVLFIGSTTENPMIAMTPAIVSRCRVFQFHALMNSEIEEALRLAETNTARGLGHMKLSVDDEARRAFASVAGGDVRSALNALELAALTTPCDENGVTHITKEIALESIQQRVLPMDDSLFYDILSAFCKSLRGSDSDAALFWMARLDYAGVDMRLVARRIVVHASEDIGMANPNAMLIAAAAMQAVETVGMPEARIPMAQAIIALCESPKSNSVVCAIDAAMRDAASESHAPVPSHLRDTSYKGAKKLGYGEGYLYPHDYTGHWVKQAYRPISLEDHVYYKPSDMGYENKIRELRERRLRPSETSDAE